jgi:hypothetical protein
MGRRTIMSNNGPTFTKATYDRKRIPRTPALSLGARISAEEQAARDCADDKLFKTKPAEWVAKHMIKK